MILGAGTVLSQEVAFVTLTPHGIPKVHEGAGRERRRLADNREIVEHGAFGLGQELSDLVRCVDNIG